MKTKGENEESPAIFFFPASGALYEMLQVQTKMLQRHLPLCSLKQWRELMKINDLIIMGLNFMKRVYIGNKNPP